MIDEIWCKIFQISEIHTEEYFEIIKDIATILATREAGEDPSPGYVTFFYFLTTDTYISLYDSK